MPRMVWKDARTRGSIEAPKIPGRGNAVRRPGGKLFRRMAVPWADTPWGGWEVDGRTSAQGGPPQGPPRVASLRS